MVADGSQRASYQNRPMAPEVSTSCCQKVLTVGKMMNRKKRLNAELLQTRLKRCLNTFDICLLGVGHMIGAGIYVLTGQVANKTAGPSVLMSFIVAGFVSLLAALCYAEFGARVPKAGSAYVYTYVTIGEFWAFVIGWDVILENMIGAASVARAWSGYLDGLVGMRIQNGTLTYIGALKTDFFSHYPDFLAFGFCLVICVFLSIGVKGSSIFNSLFTILNLVVVSFIVCVGFYYANGDNWTKVPGGFFVHGFTGVINGAATCFYAFVGFDSIATSSEEARNPGRSIPLATFLAMTIATVAYVLMSSVLTLMIPYTEINPDSAFPDAFSANGANWAKIVVTIGALAGMTTTMFGGLFSLPRCVYSMATDGLLFKCFAYVNPVTQTPIITLFVSSLLTATISLLFDIEKLVDFMSIGTLMAYTIVSVSVIILRYQPPTRNDDGNIVPNWTQSGNDLNKQEFPMDFNNGGRVKPKYTFLRFMNNYPPGKIPTWATLLMTLFIIGLCALLQFAMSDIAATSCWSIVLLVILTAAILLCLCVIAVFDQNSEKLIFTVPFVPVLPALSVFCNVYLVLHLEWTAWLRFAVWMACGMIIYFCYGIRHSKEKTTASSVSTMQLVPPQYPVSTIHSTLHNDKNKEFQIENSTKL